MDCSKKSKGTVATTLPDDSLLEILSRVPAKSLCRFKCVSKAWRDLIADPHHRKKLPQAMQGLFLVDGDMVRHGASFSFIDLAVRSVPLDIDPGFSFLTERPGIQNLRLLDSCNGLLLLGHHHHQDLRALGYIVCNPTTKRWAAVPTCGSLDLETSAYLAFDQAVSSHFHLVQFEMSRADEMLVSLHAYSSETGTWSGTWSRNQIVSQVKQGPMVGWHRHVELSHMKHGSAFVNGFLHFIVGDFDQLQIVCVDVEGNPRRMMTVPDMPVGGHPFCYLAQSQGRMHYMEILHAYDDSGKLFVWVLQDYDTQEWVLKHTVSYVEIPGELADDIMDFEVIGIHRDCNVVFLLQSFSYKLIAYNMDRKEVSVIATFEDQEIPFGFASYVPYFVESPALTN